MEPQVLAQGLITYLYLIIIITFHEFGHAWMSSRCGDDTARLLGRVTLNPIAHMDPLGTVALPILAFVLSASDSSLAGFVIGWGKPVPVNVHRLRHPGRDDLFVAMAGPAMNVLIAAVAMIAARLGAGFEVGMLVSIGFELAAFSMYLCVFNLLPVPPLDGGYLLKHFSGMSYETFFKISSYGFLIVILLINFTFVRELLSVVTVASIRLFQAALFF